MAQLEDARGMQHICREQWCKVWTMPSKPGRGPAQAGQRPCAGRPERRLQAYQRGGSKTARTARAGMPAGQLKEGQGGGCRQARAAPTRRPEGRPRCSSARTYAVRCGPCCCESQTPEPLPATESR
eukprot:364251-Chlamydomonas_euryale.AAC.7